MARRATKDTYAFEKVPGATDEIRRLVKAGDFVPENYRTEGGDFEEVDMPTTTQSTFGAFGNTGLTEPTAATELQTDPTADPNARGAPASDPEAASPPVVQPKEKEGRTK